MSFADNILYLSDNANITNCSFVEFVKDRLKRIVVDEVHVLLTQNHFRKAMADIKYISKVTCSKVLLSATVPIKMEKILLKNIGLSAMTTVIREPCIQLNAKYHHIVVPQGSGSVHKAVERIARYLIKTIFKRGSKGIIFFTSKKECEVVAEKLKDIATYYHSGQQKNLKSWTDGNVPIICGTSGLIAGVDLPFVDFILFAEYPYGMIDFVQGAGRGGRQGRPCYVVLVDNGRYTRLGEGDDMQCMTEMIEWCKEKSTVCHRRKIAETMDGIARSCYEIPSALPCAVCAPNETITKSIRGWQLLGNVESYSKPDLSMASTSGSSIGPTRGVKRRFTPDESEEERRKRMREELSSNKAAVGLSSRVNSAEARKRSEEYIQFLRSVGDKLTELQGKCTICKYFPVYSGNKQSAHEVAAEQGDATCKSCLKILNRFLHTEFGYTHFASWKKVIKYPRPYSYCYFCDTLQVHGDPVGHGEFGKGKLEHKSKDIVSSVWILPYIDLKQRRELENKLGRYGFSSTMSFEEYCMWLSCDDNGNGPSNGLRIFGIVTDIPYI